MIFGFTERNWPVFSHLRRRCLYCTLVVVPLFNPDGNERLSEHNRPLDIGKLQGQQGPLLVYTRNNAAGVNLNRDYMRQQALEMRLLQQRVCQPGTPTSP